VVVGEGLLSRGIRPLHRKLAQSSGVKTDFIRLENEGLQGQRPHDDAREEQSGNSKAPGRMDPRNVR